MRTRLFGRLGWPVSEIGVGTWSLGSMWGATDEPEAIRAIRRALDLGVNFIDTAMVYGDGRAEELIAEATAGHPTTAIVATKIPPKNGEWPARHDAPVDEAFPAGWIIRCTESSLRRFRRDTIDLQQLHVWAPGWLAERDRWLPAIERLKRQGKIRAFGISVNDHQPDTALELVASGLIDSIQVIYNLFDQTPALALLPACERHRVAVIARVPFDEGSLAGGLTTDTVFAADDWRSSYFRGERLQDTVERVDRLRPLAQAAQLSLPRLALTFCLSHPAVSTVIPGMRKVRHVDENVGASADQLSGETMQALLAQAWPRNFYQ